MTSNDKPRISDLLESNSKREVETSIGTLYVRHIVYRDYKAIGVSAAFKAADARQLGLLAIQAVTSRLQENGEWAGLTDEDFSELTDSDLEALAVAAIEKAEYEVVGDAITGLGHGVLEEFTDLTRSSEEISKKFRSGLSFLNAGTVSSLTASVAAIEQSNQKWSRGISKLLGGAVPRTARSVSGSFKENEDTFLLREPPQLYAPKLDLSKMPENRAARASEQTVEILSKVAMYMGEVQSHIASMYTTIVLEAIPQWTAQQKSNEEQSEKSLRSAASSLRWTKWAVILSVITSIGIAGWQQYSGSKDAQEALLQANDLRAFWQEQAAAQQALLKTQIQETQNLRAELKMLNARRDKLPAATSGNATTPKQSGQKQSLSGSSNHVSLQNEDGNAELQPPRPR